MCVSVHAHVCRQIACPPTQCAFLLSFVAGRCRNALPSFLSLPSHFLLPYIFLSTQTETSAVRGLSDFLFLSHFASFLCLHLFLVLLDCNFVRKCRPWLATSPVSFWFVTDLRKYKETDIVLDRNVFLAGGSFVFHSRLNFSKVQCCSLSKKRAHSPLYFGCPCCVIVPSKQRIMRSTQQSEPHQDVFLALLISLRKVSFSLARNLLGPHVLIDWVKKLSS